MKILGIATGLVTVILLATLFFHQLDQERTTSDLLRRMNERLDAIDGRCADLSSRLDLVHSQSGRLADLEEQVSQIATAEELEPLPPSGQGNVLTRIAGLERRLEAFSQEVSRALSLSWELTGDALSVTSPDGQQVSTPSEPEPPAER